MEPLTPAVFHILLSLADGEKHGYGIMREVADSTGQRFQMGPGTLYGTLKRLLEARWVEECGERPDPKLGEERRRYYRITKSGLQAARAETERLKMVLRVARRKPLLQGEG